MFEVGQKVKLVRGDSGLERHGFREGDIVVVAGRGGGDTIGVESLDGLKRTPSFGWFEHRFEAVSFAPKFKKGQRLLVVDASPQIDGSSDRLAYATFKNGDAVVAGADSNIPDYEGAEEEVRINGISWIARRFEVAPEEPRKPEPKFKKGQKVMFAGYFGSAQKGDLAVINEDVLVGDRFAQVTWLLEPRYHTQCDGGYFAHEFVPVVEAAAAPAAKPFTPTFKRGAWLKLKDADGQTFLKAGEIVKATRASYLGVDGKELVDFLDTYGYARVFYASRFAVEAHPEFPPETYLVIEPNGESYQTCDLNEVDDGETVAIYKLERVGISKKSVVTVE
jgi:hypothetical protein